MKIVAISLMSITLIVLFSIDSVSAQTLQSDEFDGSGQALQPFWQVNNGDKSAWELNNGQLNIDAGFNQNLWASDTTTRFYQATDKTHFEIESSFIMEYADVCSVAGIVIYSPTGEWVTLKLWGRTNEEVRVQFQSRARELTPNAFLSPREGRIPIQMRLRRAGDQYEAWYKLDAQGDWISAGTATVALRGPVEIGIFAGICQPEGSGRLTATFDYFRVTASTEDSTADYGPPKVRLIYFLPNDRPYRPDIVQKMKDEILVIQTFYAEQMGAHGYGNKTFHIETDSQGEPMVHRADGQYPDRHYEGHNRLNNSRVIDEINQMFDLNVNIYFIIIDNSAGHLRGGGSRRGKNGGFALLTSSYFWAIAHELGHGFGLHHDFRDDAYIMSYGWGASGTRGKLSPCHAEYLSVHPYFNARQQSQNVFDTTIQMLPPSLASPPNAIRLRFEVTDHDGLHQAQLLTPDLIWYGEGYPAVIGCERLTGTNSTVEFVTTELIPRSRSVGLQVVDVHGNISQSKKFPIDITSLLPLPEVVSIPDVNLAAAMRETLGQAALTSHTMLELSQLRAPNRHITDLTGLEYAINLTELNLGGKWVNGSYVNSNAITNFSPLSKLIHLKTLNLSGASISDVSALVGFTRLTTLNLSNNPISDVSPLAGLTQLLSLNLNNTSISDVSVLVGLTKLNALYLSSTSVSDISVLSSLTRLTILYLGGTSVSDILALGDLTNLTELHLGSTSVSDISVLSSLTDLTTLSLSNSSVSDISALGDLTNLTTLSLWSNSISDLSPLVANTGLGNGDTVYLQRNPLSYQSIYTHIPVLQSRGVTVEFDNRTPTTLLKISGTEQQAVVNTTLSHPFVVEVRDQHNRAFSGVPVTFAVTAGGGKLGATRATTDENGRVQVRLTLGQTVGTTTVSVAVPEISQPVRFTATALLLSSPVTVPDAALRARIATTLGKPPSGSLTVGDMLRLTALTANNANIRELTGLHHASNLTTLSLDNNSLSDVSSLAGLPKLKILSLDDNNLSNVSSLGELAQLTTLSLDNNSLSDVAPLAALTQLKTLHLRGNPLSYPSLRTHIPAMQARGVVVTVDPRTPTRLLNISSTHGVTGATLPFVVEVQDQHNRAFSGVPVAFAVTAGGGHLSAPTAITNITGRARTTLTLGEMPGKNTVRVSVAEVPQPVRFTITAIDVSFLVTIPDAALRAKIAETLGKSGGVQLTAGDMLGLTRLDALNANIQDLTGLEYAYNLTTLNLGGEWVSGKGYVNSNAVSNFSSLLGLTQLTTLNLVGSFISDVSALSGLTQLNTLYLSNNAISDVAPLAGLTQLNTLVLSNNAISDVSSLSGLTQLNVLNLSGNTISDVSALSGLTQLKWLYLSGTSISDVSALAGLTQLNWLVLGGTSISDVSPLAGLTQLTTLYLNRTSISDVSALSGLIKMQFLSLAGTSISDVSALAGLTRLNWLDLSNNSLSDASALVGLTKLTQLILRYNAISDVSPLLGLNLTGTAWNTTGLYIEGNPLSYASINTHIPAMQARGIEVKFDNRTPTTLVKISGAEQQATVNAVLPRPFVVEVRDERNRAFSGVPVTFTVTAGGGTLSVTNTTTNENGRAQTTLTLGPNPETNTVEVAAAEIKTPVTFNAVPGGHLLSVPAGISLIHVPLKVTAVDGVAKPITSISDLYDALGGADTVNFLITYDSQTQQWFGYFGPSDTGTPDDRGVTDDTGIIAGMITPVSV